MDNTIQKILNMLFIHSGIILISSAYLNLLG